MEGSTKPTATIRKQKFQKRRKQIRHAKNPNFLFSLALAAAFNPENPSSSSLVKACLTEFHRRLLLLQSPGSTYEASNELFLSSILALLPFVLKSRCAEIVSTSLKILGSVSLISYEMNGKIVLEEGETLRLLLPKVLCGESEVAMAACNAMLDISTTSLGRGKLLEFSALNYLMLGFVQVMKFSTSLPSLSVVSTGVAYIGVELPEDVLPVMLLGTSVFLVNSCNMEQLEHLPRKLTEVSVTYMKRLWVKLWEGILCGEFKMSSNGRKSYTSNVTANDLAEGIFRLSLNENFLDCGISSEIIQKCLFGVELSGFIDFISTYWESSPFILRSVGKTMQHDIFDQFMISLNLGTTPLRLSSLLRGMVSCHPLASNEMDIIEYLKEVKSLASPIIYQQDIRVVRTEPHLETGKHFMRNISENGGTKIPFNMSDILKCEEAFKEGYTVALRGMEFRMRNIGAFAEELASIFGQPSVGANLYLTPPDSQGLACHYDDHCVFVCQLHGSKLWTVYSKPFIPLPRLYDSLKHVPDLVAGRREILLHEGDVLYIPRGFPHKACTVRGSNEVDANCDYSLHLTFGIEVEPPFEWEGFMHLALHRWCHNNPKVSNLLPSFLPEHIDTFSLILLHVSITLVSRTDSAFRKACMVAAAAGPLSSATQICFEQNQRSIFYQLIRKVSELSNFSTTLQYLRQSAQMTDDDLFPWMRWLYLLDDEQTSRYDCLVPAGKIGEFLTSINKNHDEVACAYATMKSKFCEEVLFDDVRERYKMLLAAFKKVRKHYMNGMLSLHL